MLDGGGAAKIRRQSQAIGNTKERWRQGTHYVLQGFQKEKN